MSSGASAGGDASSSATCKRFPASGSPRCATWIRRSWTTNFSRSRTRHEAVAAYVDVRKLLDDKSIDAVAIATPNHWHALATIWACQAGKDVYVEKPFSYNIWEGRQMVAAARKYGRMVQVGTQSRSSEVLRQAFDYLHSGEIGPIRCAHAIVYRAREGIGKVDAPMPVPSTVDYDLWCGPAPKAPLRRKQLHYEWHWFWSTGNGEIGNNGAHFIDVCRWALGQDKPPPRAVSIGGRFAFHDDGETPNTQIALLDYQPAPLLCEIRALKAAQGPDTLGKFRSLGQGVVIDCEGGYFAGNSTGGAVFDRQGQKMKEFGGDRKPVRPTRPLPMWPTGSLPSAAGRLMICMPRPWMDTSPPPAPTWPMLRTASAGSLRPRQFRRRSRAAASCRMPSSVAVSICSPTASTWPPRKPSPARG